MKNQKQWVINELSTKGRVSRNEALARYCSRLGAIVHGLNKEGYKLEGHWVHTKYGKDYIYKRAEVREPLTIKEQIQSFGW